MYMTHCDNFIVAVVMYQLYVVCVMVLFAFFRLNENSVHECNKKLKVKALLPHLLFLQDKGWYGHKSP